MTRRAFVWLLAAVEMLLWGLSSGIAWATGLLEDPGLCVFCDRPARSAESLFCTRCKLEHPPPREVVAQSLGHEELIQCPECDHRQWATVEHTEPWWTYVAVCERCDYLITESDWEQVDWNGEPFADGELA